MRNTFLVFIVFIYGNLVIADIDDVNGVRFTEADERQLFSTSVPYAVARQGHRELDELVVAGFHDANGYVYSISDKYTIVKTQKAGRLLEKSWSLARWEHQFVSPVLKSQYDEVFSDYPLPFQYEFIAPGVGCLGDTPLRYGDIEDDGDNELVIVLDGLFIVFSPEYGRTVFSDYLDASDWYTKAEMNQFFDSETHPAAQYLSQLWADNDYYGPGVRAYSKLYLGDFDQDGNADILAWRKAYRSNATDDPIKGFTHLEDNWQHFERDLVIQELSEQGVTGEYLPQDTDVQIIQAWLADNGLTWSKGYPSTSECEGQEGELIPEMHDPLLNDPEVLQ